MKRFKGCIPDSGRKRFGKRIRKPYDDEDYIVEGDRICMIITL